MGEPKKDELQEFLNQLEGEGATAPAPAQKKPELHVVEGGGADLEQTLEGLKEEPSPDSLLDQELEKEIGQVMDTLKPATSQGDGTLSLSLQGTMSLKLNYAQHGQNVTIRFEKDCLFVNLDNGTEFKIPVKS